jgi:sugar phosphate permease
MDFRMLLKKQELIMLCFIGMLLAASQTSIASFLVLYAQEELKVTATVAGLYLSLFMIGGTVGRVVWGVISDRIFEGDRHYPMILLCLLALGSALGMISLSRDSVGCLPYILCAVMGFTFMGWNALFITSTAEIATPAQVGLATGIAITVSWIGIIAGPPIFGLIADKAGYSWGWTMLAVFGFLSAASILICSSRSFCFRK